MLGRGSARAAAILLALLVASGRDLCWADQWPAPLVREVWSPSRDHFVRVTPGKGMGETIGFSGAPTGPAATAEFYRRASDRSYRPVWMVSLVNPVAPIDAFLTDRGYLATLDCEPRAGARVCRSANEARQWRGYVDPTPRRERAGAGAGHPKRTLVPRVGKPFPRSSVSARRQLRRRLPPRIIDLLTLKLFVAVVEEQGVAKAAEREHIAASAVSKRIADLEKAAKVQLFRRHHTGLRPTPAGHAFLHHARVLMRDLAQMDSEVGEYAQGVRGSLKVFANNSAMVQYLPGDLSRFLKSHPLIHVALEEAISPIIVRAVADGAADIGIYGGNTPATGLTVLPYRQDRLVVVVPAKHPLRKHASVRLTAVLPYDLVGMQEGSSIDMLVTKAATDLGQPVKLRIPHRGLRCHRPHGPGWARDRDHAAAHRGELPLIPEDRGHPARRAVGRPPARPLRAGHGRTAGGGPAPGRAPHQAIGHRRGPSGSARAGRPSVLARAFAGAAVAVVANRDDGVPKDDVRREIPLL